MNSALQRSSKPKMIEARDGPFSVKLFVNRVLGPAVNVTEKMKSGI